MKYKEAFAALGYDLTNPRQFWSVASDKGVCLSIWSQELTGEEPNRVMDTRIGGRPLEAWKAQAGNKQRIKHLEIARRDFGGKVNVVLVTGIPGVGYGTAHPLEYRWRLTYFDPDTGHFVAAEAD